MTDGTIDSKSLAVPEMTSMVVGRTVEESVPRRRRDVSTVPRPRPLPRFHNLNPPSSTDDGATTTAVPNEAYMLLLQLLLVLLLRGPALLYFIAQPLKNVGRRVDQGSS